MTETSTNAKACNPAFAYVTINIQGLSLNFQVADREGLSSFFNDHNALADIRNGMDVLNGCNVGLTVVERKALYHTFKTGADAVNVTKTDETVLTAIQGESVTDQSISTGEERIEGETTTPAKRTRRTKAEMEAARLAEAASKADAGTVPPLPATPTPAPDAAPLPSLPVMPTLPAAPALVAQNPARPDMLAGQVMDAIQALVDEGRDPIKMVEWLFAYGIVNAKDVGYETAQATIRLMNDVQLHKVAEALGLLDD